MTDSKIKEVTETPRTDAVVADDTIEYSDGVSADFARMLERELAEAQAIADSFVCDLLRNESGADVGKWGEIETYAAGLEDEMVYAAKRGLIERDPKKPQRLKFTVAGGEWL